MSSVYTNKPCFLVFILIAKVKFVKLRNIKKTKNIQNDDKTRLTFLIFIYPFVLFSCFIYLCIFNLKLPKGGF